MQDLAKQAADLRDQAAEYDKTAAEHARAAARLRAAADMLEGQPPLPTPAPLPFLPAPAWPPPWPLTWPDPLNPVIRLDGTIVSHADGCDCSRCMPYVVDYVMAGNGVRVDRGGIYFAS